LLAQGSTVSIDTVQNAAIATAVIGIVATVVKGVFDDLKDRRTHESTHFKDEHHHEIERLRLGLAIYRSRLVEWADDAYRRYPDLGEPPEGPNLGNASGETRAEDE
jgi:hypothetical protein